MRRFRLAAAAVTVALFGASASTGVAGAATPEGVGTSKASTTVLNVQLGDLLGVRVLGDDSVSNIDPKVAARSEAFSRLVPVAITSSVLGNHQIAPIEARSTGAENKQSLPATNLPLPALVGSGSVSAGLLNAVVDKDGARAGLNAALNNLQLAKGSLLDLPKLTSNLGTNAAKVNATGLRGIEMPTLDLLDLGALLRSLGIDITKLPLSTVTGLLDKLNLRIADPTNVGSLLNGTQVEDLVNTLLDTVTEVTGADAGAANTVGDLTGTLQPLKDTVTGLLDTAPGVTPPVDTTPLTDVVDDLTDVLNRLIADVLTLLDGTRLLSVKGLQLGLNAKAADKVENSDAGVVAKLGSVVVGNLPAVSGADLGAVVNQVNGLLNSVLSTVNGALGNIVQLQVLTQDKGVKADGGYVRANAGITGIAAKVVPPANLSSIVSGINGTGTSGAASVRASSVGVPVVIAQAAPSDPLVGSLLGGLTPSMPSAANIANLPAALISVLTKGASVTVGQASTDSAFAVPVTPAAPPARAVPAGELAYTGINTGLLALAGLTMAAVAAGTYGWLRRSGANA